MENNSSTDNSQQQRRRWWIEFVGFWLLGLCNNFGYVIMLSAAHNILKREENPSENSTINLSLHNTTNRFDCNLISTGAILLADILPELIIKTIAPFYIHRIPYNIRFVVIVLFAASALIVVGISNVVALSLFGVICASISSGFGEITFLQLTSFYAKYTISAWSSGTGAAGLFGALSYAALTGPLKLAPKTAILILLFIPVIQVFSYILVGASGTAARHRQYQQLAGTTEVSDDENLEQEKAMAVVPPLDFKGRLKLIRPLLKYMIPLTLVYFAEYLINQGLYELIYFSNSKIKHADQYRWYSVCYQLGVFISRSSVDFLKIHYLWFLPVIQFTNFGIFLVCIFRTNHIPSIWLVFGLVVFEGLIGGSAYVNAFYKISVEIPKHDREFSMGVASIGNSFGITVAGLSAIPLHNAICSS